MSKLTKITLLAVMAFSTLNAASPVMGDAPAPGPAVFDAAYVKSTSVFANMQGSVASAGGYVGQATCVVALAATTYVVAPLVVSSVFCVLPTFHLGSLIMPAANLAVGYKTLEVGFTSAKDFGFAHGKSIGHNACDQVVDGAFTAAHHSKSFLNGKVIPGAKSAMNNMMKATLSFWR